MLERHGTRMNKLHAVETTGTVFGTKKMIVLFLTISLAVLSGPASAGQISTIDELTAEFNSESCIECHRETHKEWKNSWHGKSIIDPRVLRTWRTFILSGLDKSEGSRRDLKDICLPCHAPQTKDASDELITSIAGMIITAVEKKDTYETEGDLSDSPQTSDEVNKVEDETMFEDIDTVIEPVEDGEIPLEPAVEVEDMTATIVVENGKVKIEYSPYDPSVDIKEPTFLDKGESLGEKAVIELSKLNINCMICHSMKALPGGNPRPKTIYGTSGSGSVEHKEALGAETRISGFMKTSEFCAQCHHGCPPGTPSSICPTIWTSYKESYMARGGDRTCQDCHMGADKKSHRFPGIYETDYVKKGITLTLDAEPTRYIYHLENRIVPAVIINVKVKNIAGHSIPHGCTYIPQTTLQVSVTDQNGNEIFFKDKIYAVYNLHLPQNMEGYLGLNDWDITAMNRINLGIEPGDTDSNIYVVPLNEETTSVVIEAVFKYLYEEGVSAVIHKETRKIEFEIEKKSPGM